MTNGIKSSELKLIRAAKHLRTIKRCIAAYSATEPHKISVKPKGKVKLNIPKGPPKEICILVGEMVYQMRSALDHLAFELVKRNPSRKPLPIDWDKRCLFPLYIAVPTRGNPKVPISLPAAYNMFSGALPNISVKAFAFIESVQPYYRNTAVSNCLRFLAELSNIDKHRYLNIVRPRTRKSESVKYASGFTSKSIQMLDRGARIETGFDFMRPDRAVYVHRRYRTSIAFQEKAILGEAIVLPVEYLLNLILDAIKRSICPRMKLLINNP